MAHEDLNRGDQLRLCNPNNVLVHLAACGGMVSLVESMLPLAARPYSTHFEMTGGDSLTSAYAGGEPLKARAVHADGSVTALTIVNNAIPATTELGWTRVAADAKVSLFLNATDTTIRTVEFAANAMAVDIVAYLASGATT